MPKPDLNDSRTLAGLWSPPKREGVEKVGAPVACLASTYTFQAGFYEAELLPRFLGLKFDEGDGGSGYLAEREQALGLVRPVVLVDESWVDTTQSTLRWDQIPVRIPGGIQHAKVSILLWERHLRIVVASANLTRPGYRRNREMASALDFYDDPSSSPRALWRDVRGFLEDVLQWARGAPECLDRARNVLQLVDSHLRRWTRMLSQFTTLERPRAYFLVTRPPLPGKRPLSALDALTSLWGDYRATDITVLTPFVGDSPGEADPVVENVRQVPRTREFRVYLGAPGRPTGTGMKVLLPEHFGKAWEKAWGEEAEESELYVVPPTRKGETLQRDLHAKAVYLENEDRGLLLFGSSNFTPRGMGVGVFNCEANLAILDDPKERRSGRDLGQRLPVRWDLDRCHRAEWSNDGELPGEDGAEPPRPRVPAAFLYAVFDQRGGRLTLTLDPAMPLPERWTVELPTPPGSSRRVLANQASVPNPTDTLVIEELPDRKLPVTAVRITWLEGAEELSAYLPVHVRDLGDLLPPPVLEGMTAAGIIECLISGRSLAEWVDLNEESGVPNKGRRGEDVRPDVDTTDFLLYRVRRLGKALATMGECIARTAHSLEALTYRVRHDPLGPENLARALKREWSAVPEAVPFALAEIALSLAHAGRKLPAALQGPVRILIGELLGGIPAGENSALSTYVRSVGEACESLVPKPEGTGAR